MIKTKIHPLFRIRTNCEVETAIHFEFDKNETYQLPYILPANSVIFSINYNPELNEFYSFSFENDEIFETIGNLYLPANYANKKVNRNYLRIYDKDFDSSKYEVTPYIYNNINLKNRLPSELLAYLFLNNMMDHINIQKLLCFGINYEYLEKCKLNFKNGYLSYLEAINYIINEIENQLKIRKN